jgi:hypothetical protein
MQKETRFHAARWPKEDSKLSRNIILVSYTTIYMERGPSKEVVEPIATK